MTTAKKYYTTSEVAKHFGVASGTIAQMVKDKEIPSNTYTRMGRVFRFDLAKLEAALLDKSAAQPDDSSEQLELDFNKTDEE